MKSEGTPRARAGYDLIALVTFDIDRGIEMGGQPISMDWGLSILVDGILYPGRVTACDKPIFPGQTGAVRLSILTFTGNLRLVAGQEFGLCAGSRQVASGRVLEIL